MKKMVILLCCILIFTMNITYAMEGNTNQTRTITISLAGDCTLGTDESFAKAGSFPDEFAKQKYDYSYFFKNVSSLFKEDDLTIVNLETTFTNATKKATKTYKFKGDPKYVNILKAGGIEAVNIANNHIKDYLEQGYKDTVETLKSNGMLYFGYDYYSVKDINGIKVGMLGYEGWTSSTSFKNTIKKNIQELKTKADIVVVSFHWGEERKYEPNQTQKDLAHFAIDNGADLIMGHHPHVVQGVEKYKNKFIVYSLGNFSFGGNRNPSDKDTFIFQQRFHIDTNKKITKSEMRIIPCSISSVKTRNNYQPTILEGKEWDRVYNKIAKLSEKL